MNGTKFDNIGLRCISMKDGSFSTQGRKIDISEHIKFLEDMGCIYP